MADNSNYAIGRIIETLSLTIIIICCWHFTQITVNEIQQLFNVLTYTYYILLLTKGHFPVNIHRESPLTRKEKKNV